MAGDDRDGTWPAPRPLFTVVLDDGVSATFLEMSGMDGDLRAAVPEGAGSVVLHRGIFRNDDRFRRWRQAIGTPAVARRTVRITLADGQGVTTTTWTLNNAWPTKITGSDLDSAEDEVAVESVEIAYETIVVSAP